jgi:hypothetical protein
MGEEKRAFKGVWICAAIFLDERLTPAEKIRTISWGQVKFIHCLSKPEKIPAGCKVIF